MNETDRILAPLRKAIELHRAGKMSERALMVMNLHTMDELQRAGIQPELPDGPVAHYLSLMEAPVA
jgi:hypothetical protein